MSQAACFMLDDPRWLRGEHLFWPAARWQALQAEALAAHLERAATSPFYRERGLPPSLPAAPGEALAALAQLPLTTKDDLAAAGASAYACAPGDIREWVTTSGSSGKPLPVPQTASDLTRLAANEAVALSIAGLQPGDTLLLAVGMDRLFVAGLAYWLGAQAIGAACLRIGPQHVASAALLAELLTRYHPTHIMAVPSFLLAHTAAPDGLPAQLRGILCIGEPIRSAADVAELNPLGQRLRERFGCPILSTYASTESCASFAEGPICRGGHLNPQMAVVEILDSEHRPVPAGTPGEVVITPLGVEGMPLLRFASGDIAALYTEPCPCGRTTPRIGPILGRRQQLLKVRGTSLYPAAIGDALAGIPEVNDYAVVATSEHALSDRLAVHVHLRHDAEATAALRHRVETHLRAVLRVVPEIVYTDQATLRGLQFATGSRKPQRFIDRRGTGEPGGPRVNG